MTTMATGLISTSDSSSSRRRRASASSDEWSTSGVIDPLPGSPRPRRRAGASTFPPSGSRHGRSILRDGGAVQADAGGRGRRQANRRRELPPSAARRSPEGHVGVAPERLRRAAPDRAAETGSGPGRAPGPGGPVSVVAAASPRSFPRDARRGAPGNRFAARAKGQALRCPSGRQAFGRSQADDPRRLDLLHLRRPT